MTTPAITGQKVTVQPAKKGFFSGRRGRVLRENLTAYLFLAPALFIVFTFGIFPILFAGYVSLYKWRIKQNEWRGLTNYVNAMGDVAYVFFLIIALAMAIMGIYTIYKAINLARDKSLPTYTPAISLVPGAVITYGLVQLLLRAITFFAWEDAIESGEAARLGNVGLGLGAIAVGILISVGVQQIQQNLARDKSLKVLPNFTVTAVTVLLTLGAAFLLSRFVFTELQASERYGLAVIRMRYLAGALALLAIGYAIWSWGSRQTSNLKLAVSILGATVFIGAGVWLATIWPVISKDSDADFYQSLSVTIWYSLGTVPVQLAVSMILAYLLFQNIKAKGLFRIIFFIPYIAPAVATAGIFQAMFSLRPSSLANRLIGATSPEAALRWIREPGSALAAFGQLAGIETAVNWEFGPSLALAVVILYNIWVFVGYDTVIFLAGLGNIPFSLYEAARIDGADRWQLFRHITFPLLSPTTYFLSVISVIGTFKAFNHIFVMRTPEAQGTMDAASVHFFVTFQRASRFGYSTSMAMVLFVIILVLYLVQNRIAARSVHYG
ncbi:MAG: sugar ABC transporter permease [Chloroflexi bacterium]|nr:MAG: sugar ABC transporter permease [Chloroflexota bacterium]